MMAHGKPNVGTRSYPIAQTYLSPLTVGQLLHAQLHSDHLGTVLPRKLTRKLAWKLSTKKVT